MVRHKENRVALLNGLLISAFVSLLLVLDAVMLESAFAFDTAGRTILFTISLLALSACAGWYIGRPLLRMLGVLPSSTIAEIALLVGKRFPIIHDRLLNALQILEEKDHPTARYSPSLIDAAFIELYEAVQKLDFSDAIDVSALRRMRKVTIIGAGAFFFLFVLSPGGFLDSLHRILHFNTSFAAPAPIAFVIEPGDVEVVRGATVPLTVRTQGQPVRTIVLHTRQHGQKDFETRKLNLPTGTTASFENVFRDSLTILKASTEYFASVEEIESQRHTITVVDRPLVRSFRVGLTYPMYMRLPTKMLDENVGDVTAFPGTIVIIDAVASKELATGTIIFSDGSSLPMAVDGQKTTGRFRLMTPKSYHLRLEDREGLSNADPIEYKLKLIPDGLPTIAILVPGKNLDLTEEMRLDLLVRITDDFGFSKLRLAHRLARSRYEQPSEEFRHIDIQLSSPTQTTQEIWHRWALSGMSLVPEDVVAYYVEVFDNDNVNGPKSARSETYLLRLPSLDEVFRDVSQSQSQSLESLQGAQSELQQLRKEIDDLRNQMKRDQQKIDWQQQKKAEELVKKSEELKNKLDETIQKMDETMRQMQENKLLSRETLEKYLELQKLMEELNSEDLQKALKKLQESMRQLSPDQIKEAMKNLQFSEETMRKSLERTIEMLKRIAIEQKLDEIIKRTEELLRQQEELQKQASQTDPSDQKKKEELAGKQQELQKQLDELQKETENLEKKMEEFAREMPLDELNEAQKELEKQNPGEQMQQASQNMRSGQMKSAQNNQQKASQSLKQFKDRMQAMREQMQQDQQQQALNEMRKSMDNLLELSDRQEQCKGGTQNLDPNSQRFRESAQQQNELQEDLARVANDLAELSRKTFAVTPEMGKEIGNAMQQMNRAMQNMEMRNPGGAGQAQNDAMGSLNRAAMQLQGAMNNMMQGGGMGMAGLMQQLQGMSGQQMGINAQSQAMLGEGQSMSAQQQAEWSRLGGQQGAVRKSIEQLAKEAASMGELSKLLGDLNKITQDMYEVQTDMEQGNVNPETLRKQDRILSRLLDSQRSMRERDYEKRRRAETGQTITRSSPRELDLSTQEGRSKLREELLRTLEQRYSKDYEELIRRYFETLEKLDSKEQN